MNDHRRLSRRNVLKLGAWGAGGLMAGTTVGCGPSATPAPTAPAASPSAAPDFSVAFLTDPHVRDQAGAPQGFEQAVAHALAHNSPEMVITGGDLAFDIMATDKDLADEQYGLFDQGVSSVKVPMHHTVGNHDCFGVNAESPIPLDDPLFGKGYFTERFGLDKPYQSFDHEGWHFVTLDTIGIVDERGFEGRIDAEQLAWLDDDLAAANKPTVVIGHVPIFTHYVQWMRGAEAGLPGGAVVVNAHEVAQILVKHPVKLVLAGHLHINEVFHYKGIEFANIGAVSGNWWQGERDGFEEGYAMLDFASDEVSWRYVDYGWEVSAS